MRSVLSGANVQAADRGVVFEDDGCGKALDEADAQRVGRATAEDGGRVRRAQVQVNGKGALGDRYAVIAGVAEDTQGHRSNGDVDRVVAAAALKRGLLDSTEGHELASA
jgi:hypothetical protein